MIAAKQDTKVLAQLRLNITIISNDIKIREKISINNIPTGLEVISLKATTQGQVSIDIKSLVSGQFYVIMTNHKFIGKFHKK